MEERGQESVKWSELLQDLQIIAIGRPVNVSKYNWTSRSPHFFERLWEARRLNSTSYTYQAIPGNFLADLRISCWYENKSAPREG